MFDTIVPHLLQQSIIITQHHPILKRVYQESSNVLPSITSIPILLADPMIDLHTVSTEAF